MIFAVLIVSLYAGFIVWQCIFGWKGEEGFMSSLPEDQKPGSIKVVSEPLTPVDKTFIYAQDKLSRFLFGRNVNNG